MPIILPPPVAAVCQSVIQIPVRLDFRTEDDNKKKSTVSFVKLETIPKNASVDVNIVTGYTELEKLNSCVEVSYRINKSTTAEEFHNDSVDGHGDGQFLYTNTVSDSDKKIRQLELYYKNDYEIFQPREHEFELYAFKDGTRYDIDPKYHNPGPPFIGELIGGLLIALVVALSFVGLVVARSRSSVRKQLSAPPPPALPPDSSMDND